jgi:hypothetical protein
MIQPFRHETPVDLQAILDVKDPNLRMFGALIAYRREKQQEQKTQKYDDYLASLQRPMKQAEARRARERAGKRRL